MSGPPTGPRVLVVDAFTCGPFTGNPAAVCLPGGGPPPGDAALQALAAQLNLSETAYPRPRGDGGWDLRWFTPAREVPLCGHATLASAHAIWAAGLVDPGEEITFHTRSGPLRVAREHDRIVMDFPALAVAPVPVPAAATAALGAPVLEAGTCGVGLFAVLPDAAAVRGLRPDPAGVAALDGHGVLVSAAGGDDDDADVVSRYFAPNAGIPEDPVTGAAHCALAPFWQVKLGRDALHCRQLSARGGEVWARAAGDRVRLAGRARTVLDGRLTEPLTGA